MENDYKTKINMYPWYDYQSIEGELTRMAAKGWQLDSITGSIWSYKKAEPADKRFEAVFSKKARPNRVEPTEEEQELEEMCAEAGWEKVGKWKKMVIFSNDDKDAAPLETDRYAKLESVRRSSKKTLMSEFAALILLAVLLAVILGIYLIDAPYYWELNVIYYGIMGLLVFTMGALEIGGYFKWLKRSRENIERGIDCWGTEKTGRKVQALSLAFFGISVIVVIVCVVILIWIN